MDNSTASRSDQPSGAAANRRIRPALAAAALFGALLGISLAMLAVGLGAYLAASGRAPVPTDQQSPSLVLAISVATSIVSLIGLLSTNLLAWRREVREARSAEIQIQRQQLEIEKLRLELEKQRREQ